MRNGLQYSNLYDFVSKKYGDVGTVSNICISLIY